MGYQSWEYGITMNPTVAPQPITSSPQGAASVTPIQAPTAPALPTSTPLAVSAPPTNPNLAPSTSAQMGNIAAYYQIPRDTARIAGAGQAMGAVAQSQFEAQKYQNELSIEHEKDQLDPTKYTITKNPVDGGVIITNTLGQKVDLATYVNLTGANPADVLKTSTNPADQKFVAAYNNLQSFIQTRIAAQNGDLTAKAQLGDFYKANPGLQNLDLGKLSSAFMQQYGSYMGQPSNPSANQLGAAAGVNPTIASANNPATTSPYLNVTGFPRPTGTNNAVAQALTQGLNPMGSLTTSASTGAY